MVLLLCFSCGKDKVILLPEIENAKITEVLDVSPAYLFYNETLTDSIELNRKNIISTTNWLVNVDKRLTLKQAIPKIKFLQDKKRNAQMHKNENAKNYFTCNATSIKNLGFIEFTDVVYEFIESSLDFKQILTSYKKIDSVNELEDSLNIFSINFHEDHTIYMHKNSFKIEDLTTKIKELAKNPEYKKIQLKLTMSKSLTFQDYITFKSLVLELESDSISIDNNEFIY